MSSRRRSSHVSMLGQKLSALHTLLDAVEKSSDHRHTSHRRVTTVVLRRKPPHPCAVKAAAPGGSPEDPSSSSIGTKEIQVKKPFTQTFPAGS